MTEEKKLHWLMVGKITTPAMADIAAIEGFVAMHRLPVGTLVYLVGIPYPTFELQEGYEVRVKAGGRSFIWAGTHPGPEWNNAAETTLRCEYGELSSAEPVSTEALDLDLPNFDTFMEHLGEPPPKGEAF